MSVLFGDLLSQSYNITFSMFLYLVIYSLCLQARTQGWFGWFQRIPLAGLEVAVLCRETTGPPLGCCRLHLKASKKPPSFELWVRAWPIYSCTHIYRRTNDLCLDTCTISFFRLKINRFHGYQSVDKKLILNTIASIEAHAIQ